MVKFLLNKPIAVTMTFIAIMIVGMVAVTKIPVSLMPNIAIPEITVQVGSANTSAREMENSIVRSLRQQLMQVAHLDDINSETIDGNSTIRLKFTYGTDINYAFIEVNEKVDRAMSYLPRTLQRPKVIKANVSDVPVFFLNLSLKNDLHSKFQISNSKDVDPVSSIQHPVSSKLFPVSSEFVDLSRFASNVISKRLEQLPEVAMVDRSGLAKTEILIVPDENKLDALGITLSDLENLIKNNNIQLGNLSIKDGQYIYNVRFESTLRNKADIQNIYLKVDNRLLQIKDIAEVIEHPQKLRGKVISNNGETITLAVIKQSDAQMNTLKGSLHDLVNHFEADYPDIQFEIVRDQTKLLDYSINNLKQSLWWGALLAFFVMFFFMRDIKSPLLIGITIPVSLILSLLFFYLIGISINIISLSGLILGVGMMVDNSIIVIDNITQHFERNFKFQKSNSKSTVIGRKNDEAIHKSTDSIAALGMTNIEPSIAIGSASRIQHLFSACISGTNEVIRPMLSSVLTTCAVFIPLIFINGIAGSLFYDQAMAITIGLFTSLAVSITILPVYYLLFFRKGRMSRLGAWMNRLNAFNYEAIYERGFRFTMRHQKLIWVSTLIMLLAAVGLFKILPQSKLPLMDKDELMLKIDWNDRINVEENEHRTKQVIQGLENYLLNYTGLIGEQQFLLDKNSSGSEAETMVYLRLKNPSYIDSVKQIARGLIHSISSKGTCTFNDADNIFNAIFSDQEQALVAKLRATNDYGKQYNSYLKETRKQLEDSLNLPLDPILWQEQTVLKASAEKMLLYNVSYDHLYNKLKTLFNENEIALITDNNDFVPVVLGGKSKNLEEIIQESSIENTNGESIPIRELFKQHFDSDLKTILAGKEGEYYAFNLTANKNNTESIITKVRELLKTDNRFEVSFSGTYFSNREMIKQLLLVLLISITLLYFILATQFESLVLPLIVLLEIPIDIFGALLFLWLFGSGINLMSLIGIVVMCGIIINDSILKIDTINQLRNEGYGLLKAIAVAGQRRLKPILMTSITTILALVPFLFTHGTGSDLQRPLALAVIGGMLIGTLVSLFIVPLGYYYLAKVSRTKNSKLQVSNSKLFKPET